MTHLLRTRDLSPERVSMLLDRAEELKRNRGREGRGLGGRGLGLLFEKSSTRTRVSLEVAATELGAHPTYLSRQDLQLGRGESVDHTAKVLSSYLGAVAIRTHSHALVEEFATHSSSPVINALSDEAHPLQSLADLLTMRETRGDLENASIAWVGDGNNVANSIVEGAALAGMEVRVATPPGYEPDQDSLDFARDRTDLLVATDPEEAVEGVDAVYTDVWVSMGDEEEKERRMRDFADYAVTPELLTGAPDAELLHCMPIQGPEISEELVDSERSSIFRQAENRLHSAKAVLEWLIGDR